MFPESGHNSANYFLSSTFSFLESMDGIINPDFPAILYATLVHCLQYDMNNFALHIFNSAIHAIDSAFRGNPARTLHTVLVILLLTALFITTNMINIIFSAMLIMSLASLNISNMILVYVL